MNPTAGKHDLEKGYIWKRTKKCWSFSSWIVVTWTATSRLVVGPTMTLKCGVSQTRNPHSKRFLFSFIKNGESIKWKLKFLYV